MSVWSYICVLCISLCAVAVATSLPSSDAVLFSKVDTLELRIDQMARRRWSSPVPQLQCVGGNAVSYAGSCNIVCSRLGNFTTAGEPMSWNCSLKGIGKHYFDVLNAVVSCEGWHDQNDPYILAGSCSVQYELWDRNGKAVATDNYLWLWCSLFVFLAVLLLFGLQCHWYIEAKQKARRCLAKILRNNGALCIICHEEDNINAICMSCKNSVYHGDCILEWTRRNKSCPVCMASSENMWIL